MPGIEQIRVPGEQSHATWLERSALGIPLSDALFKDLQRLATSLGIEGLPDLNQPRAFSMNCGRSALFQSGMALIFFSFNSPSAICCR